MFNSEKIKANEKECMFGRGIRMDMFRLKSDKFIQKIKRIFSLKLWIKNVINHQ